MKIYLLAVIVALLFPAYRLESVLYAQSDCKNYNFNLEKQPLIAGLDVESKVSNIMEYLSCESSYPLKVARSEGGGSINLQKKQIENNATLSNKEPITSSASKVSENISSINLEAWAEKAIENNTLKRFGAKDIAEKNKKERTFLEYQKRYEPPKVRISEKGEHVLIIGMKKNVAVAVVENEIKTGGGYLDKELDIKELGIYSISVPIAYSQMLFDILSINPNIESVEYDHYITFESVVPSQQNDTYSVVGTAS